MVVRYRYMGHVGLPAYQCAITLLDLSAVLRFVPKKSSSGYWLALAALVLERNAILDPTAAKTLPSSIRAVVLDGAGHMPHIEAASTVNEKDAVDRQ